MKDFINDLPKIILLYIVTMLTVSLFWGLLPGVVISTTNFTLAIIIAYAM